MPFFICYRSGLLFKSTSSDGAVDTERPKSAEPLQNDTINGMIITMRVCVCVCAHTHTPVYVCLSACVCACVCIRMCLYACLPIRDRGVVGNILNT